MNIPPLVGVAVRLSSGRDYSVRLSSQVHASYFWIRHVSQGLCHNLETKMDIITLGESNVEDVSIPRFGIAPIAKHTTLLESLYYLLQASYT
jgi:hypothetical protein